MQIAGLGLDEEQAGDDLAGGVALLQIGHRRDAVVRVVVGRELAQAQHRAVVLHHGLDRAGRVIGGDRARASIMTSSRLTASLCSRT